jgi:hypothetical protein
VVRARGNERSFSDNVIGKGGDENVLATKWKGEEAAEKN